MSGKLFALLVWLILGGSLTGAAYSPVADGRGVAGLALTAMLVGMLVTVFALIHDTQQPGGKA